MQIAKGNRLQTFLSAVVPPIIVTGFMWLVRLNDITFQETLLSGILFSFAWGPFCRWRARDERTLPVFPMLAFTYWVFFALPLYWGGRVMPYFGRSHRLSEAAVEMGMAFTLLGVAGLWLGMRCGIGRRLVPTSVVDIRPNRSITWNYVRLLAFISIPFEFFAQWGGFLLGGGMRQAIMILAGTVPLAVLVLLFRRFLRKEATAIDILLLATFLLLKVVGGISSGWVGSAAFLMIVCGAVYLGERRRFPFAAIIVLVCYVLFFQAGKATFRRVFWGERVESTFAQRISFWSNESLRNWEEVLRDPTGQSWRRLADEGLNRVSLLQPTSAVMEMTPDIVPFQYGSTYSYMLITFIPRALWPEKPTVNEANRFYQVAYGITAAEDLNSVSISVGALAESYINFGWLGLAIVMVPLGIFFDFFEHMFLPQDSGWMLNAIGIALIPSFLGIESQLAVYVGGILQAIILTLIVFAPILCVRPRHEGRAQRIPTGLPAGLQRPLAPGSQAHSM